MTGAKIVIGLPSYGRNPPENELCVLGAVLRNRDLFLDVDLTNFIFVDIARNHLCREALKRRAQGATHLWTVDGDMLFPADAPSRLLAHDAAVAGGLYFGRGAPHHAVAGHFEEVPSPDKVCRPLERLPDGPEPVDYVGPGCMLVRLDTLGRMADRFGDEHWFKWQGEGHVGEDIWFCQRLRQMGVRPVVDGSLRCGHMTEVAITDDHWRMHHGIKAPGSGPCFLDTILGVEPIAHAPDAWCDFTGLYADIVDRLPNNPVVVELGCYVGRSAIVMANLLKRRLPRSHFFVVDNFQAPGTEGQANPEDDVLMRAGGSYRPHLERNLREAGVADRVTIIQGDTAEVGRSQFFDDGSVDFVFVDADHRYEGCKADIEAWLPKLKPGGVMAGHDYDWPSVQRAVADCLPGAFQRGRRCWVWRKST